MHVVAADVKEMKVLARRVRVSLLLCIFLQVEKIENLQALRRIIDDLYSAQRLLAGDALLRAARLPQGTDATAAWAKLRSQEIERTASFLSELAEGGDASIAKLALANSQIQKLATTASS